MKIKYDTETCSRCGGTGHYSCFRGDTRCFKCHGRGTQLTRAGRKAKAAFEAWAEKNLTVAASSLEPGDRVQTSSGVRTVASRETDLSKSMGRTKIGVEGTDSYVEIWNYGTTVVHYTHGASFQGSAHWPVRKAWTNETLLAAVEAVRTRTGFTVEG